MGSRTLPLFALLEVDSQPQVLSGVNSRGNWALVRLRGNVTLYAQGVDVPIAVFYRSYVQVRGNSPKDDLVVQALDNARGSIVLARVDFEERYVAGANGKYLAGYDLWARYFIPFDNAVVLRELGFALA
jgi:hypothetical protein